MCCCSTRYIGIWRITAGKRRFSYTTTSGVMEYIFQSSWRLFCATKLFSASWFPLSILGSEKWATIYHVVWYNGSNWRRIKAVRQSNFGKCILLFNSNDAQHEFRIYNECKFIVQESENELASALSLDNAVKCHHKIYIWLLSVELFIRIACKFWLGFRVWGLIMFSIELDWHLNINELILSFIAFKTMRKGRVFYRFEDNFCLVQIWKFKFYIYWGIKLWLITFNFFLF